MRDTPFGARNGPTPPGMLLMLGWSSGTTRTVPESVPRHLGKQTTLDTRALLPACSAGAKETGKQHRKFGKPLQRFVHQRNGAKMALARGQGDGGAGILLAWPCDTPSTASRRPTRCPLQRRTRIVATLGPAAD